jgi:hypothetical protein
MKLRTDGPASALYQDPPGSGLPAISKEVQPFDPVKKMAKDKP